MGDADEAPVAALLALAFDADPIFRWVEPDHAARRAFLGEFMAALVRRSLRLGELAVGLVAAPGREGASLWKTPALRELSPDQLARTGLDRIADRLSPRAQARFEAVFDPVEAALAADSPEPVWYLGVLGVAPEHQGRGWGGRLMRPILDRADRDGRAVTLETSQPRNLPLYERHGFRIRRELPPPAPGGPVVWTMKREPAKPR
jgi:ribosomal protein S18 acetylase RimI-like enzyme